MWHYNLAAQDSLAVAQLSNPFAIDPRACDDSRSTTVSSGSESGGSGTGISLVTSVHDTCLGLVALLWLRAALGLSLRAMLCGPAPSPSTSDYGDDKVEYEGKGDDEEKAMVVVRMSPWLLWRRRGSKHFRVRDCHVDLT